MSRLKQPGISAHTRKRGDVVCRVWNPFEPGPVGLDTCRAELIGSLAHLFYTDGSYYPLYTYLAGDTGLQER
jgi:hypothetical protein